MEIRVLIGCVSAIAVGIAGSSPAVAQSFMRGSLQFAATETPVENSEGVLRGRKVVAIHELQAVRGAVLVEDIDWASWSRKAGTRLVAVDAAARKDYGTRPTDRVVYCDVNSPFAPFSNRPIQCYEDQDGDGKLEKRWTGYTGSESPSFTLDLAAPTLLETPGSFRPAEPDELPKIRIGLEPCSIGRRPTFKLTVSNKPDDWFGGLSGQCPIREAKGSPGAVVAGGIKLAVTPTEDGTQYRVEQRLTPGKPLFFF